MIIDDKVFYYVLGDNEDGWMVKIADISHFTLIYMNDGSKYYKVVLRDGNVPKYALKQSEFDVLYAEWIKI